MNLDYFKAAENDIRSLPMLKSSVEILKRRQQRLMESGAPREPGGIDLSKAYSDSHAVNDTLGELLALAEVTSELRKTEDEIAEIETALSMLPKEERKVLELFYVSGYSAEKIAEQIYVGSEKTVYSIRNRGVHNFSILFYGASAKNSDRLGKK